jgi:hypothetical protein
MASAFILFKENEGYMVKGQFLITPMISGQLEITPDEDLAHWEMDTRRVLTSAYKLITNNYQN